jgi:hypothetical protein
MELQTKEKPVKQLECCCCGGIAYGRQWHNRDTGYGICSKCIRWFRTDKKKNGEPCESEEEIRDYYGIEGRHFNACIVVEWTPRHEWLLAVTGDDGSYTPILELLKKGDGTAPSYRNQLYQAAKLLAENGFEALNNPHAMIGESCGCGSCFCCAALEVLTKARAVYDRN